MSTSRSNSPTSSTCSVEEVATLSPNAVRQRNLAEAERSGHVLDLTTAESAKRPPDENGRRRTTACDSAQQQQQLTNHADGDPATTMVEVLGSLSPDAVLRRNYAEAEKAGRVWDLTNSLEKLSTSGTPPAPALPGTATGTGTSSSSSNEASNHGTNSTAAGSFLAQNAPDTNKASSPNSPGSDRTAAMNHRTELATSVAASINNNGTTAALSSTTTTTTAPSRPTTTPPRASVAARRDCDDDVRILSQQSPSTPRRLALSQSGPEHNCLYYCRRCSVRVREEWMKLCGDCQDRKRARCDDDNNVEAAAAAVSSSQSSTSSPPPNRRNRFNDDSATSTADSTSSTAAKSDGLDVSTTDDEKEHEVPASPFAQPPPRLAPRHSTSLLSPVDTTFLDDVDLGVPPPTPVVARPGQTACRICSAGVRDAWMVHCRQCHEESLSSSSSPKTSIQTKSIMVPDAHLCLACHATLRDAWMTWCRECYERGLNDAAAASSVQQH
jgi:hypothetical protein